MVLRKQRTTPKPKPERMTPLERLARTRKYRKPNIATVANRIATRSLDRFDLELFEILQKTPRNLLPAERNSIIRQRVRELEGQENQLVENEARDYSFFVAARFALDKMGIRAHRNELFHSLATMQEQLYSRTRSPKYGGNPLELLNDIRLSEQYKLQVRLLGEKGAYRLAVRYFTPKFIQTLQHVMSAVSNEMAEQRAHLEPFDEKEWVTHLILKRMFRG